MISFHFSCLLATVVSKPNQWSRLVRRYLLSRPEVINYLNEASNQRLQSAIATGTLSILTELDETVADATEDDDIEPRIVGTNEE